MFRRFDEPIGTDVLLDDPERWRRKNEYSKAQFINKQQMDYKLSQREQQKQLERRQKELEELKIQRELAEREKVVKIGLADNSLQRRQLFETNIDPKAMNQLIKMKQPIEQWEHHPVGKRKFNELGSNAGENSGKGAKKANEPKLTPEEIRKLQERQEKDKRLNRQKLIIEERLTKELPAEISKHVRSTVNDELLKLRTEFNIQNNQLSEQVISLKHQLERNQERKKNISE